MICIPNCDKIVPGMLMAALRLNIPTIFVSRRADGGRARPPTAQPVDLIIGLRGGRQAGQPARSSDAELHDVEQPRLPDLRLLLGHVHRQQHELPVRGPGHGPARQRHHPGRSTPEREELVTARGPPGRGDRRRRATSGPRDIVTAERHRQRHGARHGHGRLDQHRAAHAGHRPRGRRPLRPEATSRASPSRWPNICKVAPSLATVHMEDVDRAGGMPAILKETAQPRRASCRRAR